MAKEKPTPEDAEEPIVTDKRRIDPETGEPRTKGRAAGGRPAKGERADEDPHDISETLSDEDLEQLLHGADETVDRAAEHLEDLKRVQAEYANYRKRVERDRNLARELGKADVIAALLPVLDDLDLADSHDDLVGGPLELVAQKLRGAIERMGLIRIGEVGEEFDPALHEAIAQLPSPEATSQTIADVVQPGYSLGERLLRPAKVAVSVPEE